MAKSLVITEKPSVARDIADALGGFQEADGWFENDDFVVTFAVGHLFELLPPEEIDPKYKRWTLDVLPILPKEFKYKPKQGQSDRIRTIKKLLARADVSEVINACDAGREGELIFREIVEDLGSKKPIRRLWLQSMTRERDPRGLPGAAPGPRARGPGQRGRLPRALGLADRDERDARAHQAAQEPQGEDRLVGGARADAHPGHAGRARARDPGACAAPLLARERQLRARGRALHRRVVRPGFRGRRRRRGARRSDLRRGARHGDRGAGGRKERHRRGDAQALARSRRRRSSISPASSARATAASAGRRGARSRPRSGSTSATSC